jgi:protein TonB
MALSSMAQNLRDSRYAGDNRYLSQMDFGMMLILAGALHLVGLVVYHLLPDTQPDEIPVKVLNVRFGADMGTLFDPYGTGDGFAPGESQPAGGLQTPGAPEAQEVAEADQPRKPMGAGDEAALAHPPSKLDEMLSQLENEEEQKRKNQKKEKSKPKPAQAVQETDRKPVNQQASTAGVRYVRPTGQWGSGDPTKTVAGSAGEGGTGAASSYGSPLGNSTAADAELLRRYEQVISLWISRHVFYPEEARAQNRPQGEAKVLIRVNREGRILGYRINESSGHAILDRAIPTILDRANPLPRNPNYDASKDYESYVVPIAFERID